MRPVVPLKTNKMLARTASPMDEVLYYLELKNQYYEKFQQMTRKFLDRASQNHWDGLDFFVENRERVLKIIQYFDHKIATVLKTIPAGTTDVEAYREQVRSIMKRRQLLGQTIVQLDLELMGKLDDVRNETIRELKKTQDMGHKLGSYNGSPEPEKRRVKAA